MTQQMMTRESKCLQGRKRLLRVHGGSVSIGNYTCSRIPIVKIFMSEEDAENTMNDNSTSECWSYDSFFFFIYVLLHFIIF